MWKMCDNEPFTSQFHTHTPEGSPDSQRMKQDMKSRELTRKEDGGALTDK